MSEQYEHNPGDHEDPVAGSTWLVGMVGAVLLTVIILGLTALLYQVQDEEMIEHVILAEPEELIRLRAEQQKQLNDPPRFQERPAGEDGSEMVRSLVIPIDQAMEIIAKEQGRS